MALGTTNISHTTVNNYLGTSLWTNSSLCTAPQINKWSKYKPIRGTWPIGDSHNTYGLDIGKLNWDYIKPNDNYRLGDFRGYEKNTSLAFPTIHLLNSEKTVQNLHPVNGPVSNTWKLRVYNEASNVRITPADFGLQNYYLGIKIWGSGVPTMYRSIYIVSNGSSSGIDFSVHCNFDYIQNSFFDLPLGSGTYYYQFFISSTQTPYSGGAYRWTTTAPSNYFPLPQEGSYINSGSFNVAKFIYVTNPAPAWMYNAYTSSNAIRIYFGSNSLFKYTSVPSSDIYGWSIKNSEGTQIGENEQAIGTYIDIYPNYINQNVSDKTENLILVSTEDASVTQTITLRQNGNNSPPPATVGVQLNTAPDTWGFTMTNSQVVNGASTFDVLVAFTVSTSQDWGPYSVYVKSGTQTIYTIHNNDFYIWQDSPYVQLGATINGSAPDGAGYTILITK